MSISVRNIDGQYVAELRFDDNGELVFTSYPAPDADSASKLAEAWWEWFEGLSDGRV
jgi:hypothetical protein